MTGSCRGRWYGGAVLAGWAVVLLPALAADEAGPPPAPVVVAEVDRQRLAPTRWVSGTVVSRNDARVAAEAAGRLLEVAEVGARVERGEALARLDDRALKLQVAQLEAEVAQIESRLSFLEQETERLQSLSERNAAARNQLEDMASQRDAARSELRAAQARLDEARDRLDHSVIRAPFKGVIAARLKREGEWVTNGDEVARVVDPQRLEVQAHGPLSTLDYLDEGVDLTIRQGKRVVAGRVRAVVPMGDDRSRLYEIRIALADSPWVAGQSVRVGLPTASVRPVVVVPRDALVLRREGAAVFRVNGDNVAERVEVTLGAAEGPLIEVQGDVHPGDRVVVRGGERLRPGQKVRVTRHKVES